MLTDNFGGIVAGGCKHGHNYMHCRECNPHKHRLYTFETFVPKKIEDRDETEIGQQMAKQREIEEEERKQKRMKKMAQLARFEEHLDFLSETTDAYEEQGLDINAAVDAAHKDLKKMIGEFEYNEFNTWLDRESAM